MFASKPQFLPRFSLRPQLMADAELCLVKNAPSVRLSGKQVFLNKIYCNTCISSMSLLTSKVAQFEVKFNSIQCFEAFLYSTILVFGDIAIDEVSTK